MNYNKSKRQERSVLEIHIGMRRRKMLVFAAVVCGEPRERETIAIDETLFYKIAAGEKAAFCQLYELTSNAVFPMRFLCFAIQRMPKMPCRKRF